ncbi:MAG TPA: hypothetical protein DCR40_02820 [Prolixibacteraceae bacterium]|nr:hypothetical protein [Prolixibacteraceae bacterium]
MKLSFILLISVFLFSFGPTSEKVENSSRPGFYIVVEDYTDRTFHKYIVESKDSVDNIFNHFFESELELGEINHPISIYNVKRSFYVARVTVYESSDGKKKFRNLKYASVYIKRSKLKPVIL